jgi:hypothetical protein
MKKSIILSGIISACLIVTIGCSRNNPGNSSRTTGQVVLKGQITASSVSKRVQVGDVSTTAPAKVMVLSGSKNATGNGNGSNYTIVDINNGAFTVTAEMGTAAALIFLDANNKYIGTMFSAGLPILPLVNLSNGDSTVIDLSTLTIYGDSIVPGHNPFGEEIKLSDQELSVYNTLSGYYKSLAKNIDADNDGVLDILTHTDLKINTQFGIYVGHWGTDDSAATILDSNSFFSNQMIGISGGTGLTVSNSNIALSGPSGNPYTDIRLFNTLMNASSQLGFIASFDRETHAPAGAPWGSAFLPFSDGTYTLTLNGTKTYTLAYTNVGINFNLVIVVPTAHTNSAGKCTSISLAYQLTNGTTIDPATILNDAMIQMSDSSADQFYNSPWLTSDADFYTVTPPAPIDISRLKTLNINYDDILGNQYFIIWE